MNQLEQSPEASILVVDDTPANLMALTAVLRPLGVRVVEASSGAEAIAMAAREQFALVLLDVQMPGIDGFEVAKRLRQSDASRETPIIFLTAIHRDEEYARKGYEIGGADYLLKPFDPDILRARARSFVDLFNQREQLRRRQVQTRTHERDEAMREVERLLAAERIARREAEEAARRQTFLAQVSGVLSSSLDIDGTLESVVRLTVPGFADWCAIHLADDSGALSLDAVAHGDPPNDGLWSRLSERSVVLFDVPGVIAANRASLGAPTSDASTELIDLAKEIGLRSWMSLPLRRRDAVIGALSLASTHAGQVYTSADVAFAEEVAIRVAMAVENAQLYRRAQAAIRIREDFVSIASHELKTPLTPLKLQLASLQRRLPEDRKTLMDRLAVADRQVDKIEELVSQLLDVSKIAAGRFDLQPQWVDLGRIAERVIERFATSPTASQLRLQGAARAFLDPFRIEQLVTNLVSNAMKYGEGKPIDVEISADDERARITVRDHGIGIGTREQARIFDRFERAVSSNEYGGFGLGLWIARQVVEASGGKISVASELGKGAEFTVVLPRGAEKDRGARDLPASGSTRCG